MTIVSVRRLIHPAVLAGGWMLALALPSVDAVTVRVEPGTLEATIATSAPGDRLVLAAGRHHGRIVIDRPLTLDGESGAILDGGGHARVVTVAAPGVTVRGLRIVGSGLRLDTEDAGIYITAQGRGALIERNQLEGNLIGIYLKGPAVATVRDNIIVGRADLRVNERGNGVQLWNTPGSVVEGNDISFGRDGIFVTTSRENRFVGNRMRSLRFAVHYMYTNDSEVSDNLSEGNNVGYALMYSHRLVVRGNVSRGDRDRGLFFNYANDSQVVGNRVAPGPEKCVFIYNSNNNRFADNRFEGCDIGVHFTAGSEGNRIGGNAFIGSRNQVKYVGTQTVEWTDDGRGNYWSDNVAFDLDADGVADQPYRPNGMVDRVMWRHPLAKLLLNSPAAQILRWAQAEFPALHPGGVIDRAPLMAPGPQPAGGASDG